MGKRGPAPKPTKLREAQGNPGRKKIAKSEVAPQPGIPPIPSFLTPMAKREWKRVSKLLAGLGLLSELDMAALAAYCVAWDRFRRSELKLRGNKELVVTNALGYKAQNPWLQVANKAQDQMNKFFKEFGLTPAARVGLSPTIPPDENRVPEPRDPLADLLKDIDGAPRTHEPPARA